MKDKNFIIDKDNNKVIFKSLSKQDGIVLNKYALLALRSLLENHKIILTLTTRFFDKKYKEKYQKTGIEKIGNSAIDFGLGVELDLKQTFKSLGLKGKYEPKIAQLRTIMSRFNFHYSVRDDEYYQDHCFTYINETQFVNHHSYHDTRNTLEYFYDDIYDFSNKEIQEMANMAERRFKLMLFDDIKEDGVFNYESNRAFVMLLGYFGYKHNISDDFEETVGIRQRLIRVLLALLKEEN